MRLININTLELRDWGHNPPPYAITSHRWFGDGDEVTFKEISQGLGQEKKGYKKIKDFCKATKRLVEESPQLKLTGGLEWLWIDTCCIDKDSMTDFTKSVNYMFRWYADAAVCLAWLRSVPSLDSPPKKIHDSMRDDEWWTRGWCLQELLAPKLVLFYNSEWELVGRKSTYSPGVGFSTRAIGLFPLTEWIVEWTGIPANVLADISKASELSVTEKRSWIKNRKTTEPEDIVYCQIGIFEISLSLIYGEGVENATWRFEEAMEAKERRERARSEEIQSSSTAGAENSLSPAATSDRPRSRSFVYTFNIHYEEKRRWHFSSEQVMVVQMIGDETIRDIENKIRNKLELTHVQWAAGRYMLTRSSSTTPFASDLYVHEIKVKNLYLRRG